MSVWKKRIEAVFSVDLPIGDGSGNSLLDPLKIKMSESTDQEYIISQWLRYRSLLEEKDQKLLRKVPMQLDGKHFMRYDMLCCSHSFTEDISRTEHLYFDLSEWESVAEYQLRVEQDIDKESLPQLFSNLQDYVDYYLDDEALNRYASNDNYSLSLKRCPDSGRWALILEDLTRSKAAGTILLPLDPTPQNLHHFDELCMNLAATVRNM